MSLPKRKLTRLKGYDYSDPGAYFITICVKNRKEILSEITETNIYEQPQNTLTPYGKVAHKHLINMSNFYDDIKIEKFVIMPNHIHMLIQIYECNNPKETSQPTIPANSSIAKFISTFKRFCNKEYGENIWQARSHDHIIRGEADYIKIYEYIDTNVINWESDCFYKKEE